MKKDRNLQEIVEALGLGTLGLMGILYVVLAIVVRAWCITKLWLWFVVPLGVPALGILAAIGLTMTLSVLLGLHRLKGESETVLKAIAGYLMATGFAWCIHYFM
jgi:hypothetical protein